MIAESIISDLCFRIIGQGIKIRESVSLPDSISVSVENKSGFNLGILACFTYNPNICLRINPSLNFEERGLLYSILSKAGTISSKFRPMEFTYLSFPTHLKLSTNRIGNFKPYFLSGGFCSIDMDSSKVPSVNKITAEVDYGYSFGLGCDFYLTYFKLGLELKYNAGSKNILLQQNNIFTAPLESIKTRLFVLSLTFEG